MGMRFIQNQVVIIVDDFGRIIKWRGLDQDIAASKQFEDILRTQGRAMESASVGICICDAKKSGFQLFMLMYRCVQLQDIREMKYLERT
jgi:PAS domain-containing protein